MSFVHRTPGTVNTLVSLQVFKFSQVFESLVYLSLDKVSLASTPRKDLKMSGRRLMSCTTCHRRHYAPSGARCLITSGRPYRQNSNRKMTRMGQNLDLSDSDILSEKEQTAKDHPPHPTRRVISSCRQPSQNLNPLPRQSK